MKLDIDNMHRNMTKIMEERDKAKVELRSI